METEEVCVGEELVCLGGDLARVNKIEEAVNVLVNVSIVEVDKGRKDVD